MQDHQCFKMGYTLRRIIEGKGRLLQTPDVGCSHRYIQLTFEPSRKNQIRRILDSLKNPYLGKSYEIDIGCNNRLQKRK
jgi:hypothetical protein